MVFAALPPLGQGPNQQIQNMSLQVPQPPQVQGPPMPALPQMPTFAAMPQNPWANMAKYALQSDLGYGLAGQMFNPGGSGGSGGNGGGVNPPASSAATTPPKPVNPYRTTPKTSDGTNAVPSGYYQNLAGQYASQYGVPSDLFSRQINQESGFNPTARSGAGAIGIAQIMPQTAQGWNVDPTDPKASLQAAARAMSQYKQQFGSWAAALVAYNAGPGAAQTYLRTGALPAETRRYLAVVLGNYQ